LLAGVHVRVRRSALTKQEGAITSEGKIDSIRFIALVRCDASSEQLVGARRESEEDAAWAKAVQCEA